MLDEHVFQFTFEAGALERLGKKIAFQCVIFQVFTDCLKTFLPVDEDADDIL